MLAQKCRFSPKLYTAKCYSPLSFLWWGSASVLGFLLSTSTIHLQYLAYLYTVFVIYMQHLSAPIQSSLLHVLAKSSYFRIPLLVHINIIHLAKHSHFISFKFLQIPCIQGPRLTTMYYALHTEVSYTLTFILRVFIAPPPPLVAEEVAPWTFSNPFILMLLCECPFASAAT